MQQQDDFTRYHKKLLDGHYDCVDRIVLNGYFPLGQQSGGFRTWWRMLNGSDDSLDQKHLQDMAGRFSRRLRGWAKKNAVPVIYCAPGTRKHELAETYLPQDPHYKGLFLILMAKAPGLVWKVTKSKNGQPHLQRKTPWPYINHYHFHIIDAQWGHITIKISGHPPFGIQIMINGHEWVERQADKQTIFVQKEGNCFVGGSFQGLDQIADTFDALDSLIKPSQRGNRRLAGIDLQQPRIQAVSQAVLALSAKPQGFTVRELAEKTRQLNPGKVGHYTHRQAAYDLMKLRGKKLVERIRTTRYYRIKSAGIRILAGLLTLREKVIKPVLAGLGKPRVGRPPKKIHPIDQHYMNLQREMQHMLITLGLVA